MKTFSLFCFELPAAAREIPEPPTAVQRFCLLAHQSPRTPDIEDLAIRSQVCQLANLR